MNVLFHPAALQEFLRSRRWYAARDVRVEQRFVNAVDDAIVRAMAEPESHPIFRQQFREVRIRRFPFALYFAVTDRQIVVYAIAHGHRRPGYWTRRRPPVG